MLCAILALAACGNRHITSDAPVVTVYYDNDVHCNIGCYDEIAALKASTPNSLLVSAGDFVQGGSLGAVSRGGYIVELMNAAGYDVVTLGNHEFDYGMERLAELSDSLDADITVCNLFDLRDGRRVYSPYVMKEVAGMKLAFVGVATPYSFFSSTPSYFQDGEGRWVYSLCNDNIYKVVEKTAKMARRAGADYVIGLMHVGDDPQDVINSRVLVASTTGLDVLLDGHSHSVIAGDIVKDRLGRDVLLTSTGYSFQYIGRLQLRRGAKPESTLLTPDNSMAGDPAVQKLEADIEKRYESMGSRIVGENLCEFPYADESSPRMVRNKETALGDFCADMFRQRAGTDIAVVGGGSIRKALPRGSLTFNDLFLMFPFGSTLAVGEFSGSTILDMLEFSVRLVPVDFGGFLQVSGLSFDVDTSVPSPVILDEKKAFAGFSGGKRRVGNVRIVKDDGSSCPLDPDAVYTVAGTSYTLKDMGDGYNMLGGRSVRDTGVLDLQMAEDFLTENLGGTVPPAYAEVKGRITRK